MERAKWTDNLLDQKFAAMDEKFDLLHSEMRAGFARLDAAMEAMRSDFAALHRQLIYITVSLWLGILGLFGALVAKL